MRFLYHEIRSTGSIEEEGGHTDSMERYGLNLFSSWKGKDFKYKI